MKGLSPSGVELEVMTLATFDFSSKDAPNALIGRFLEAIELTITKKQDSDYAQALLNCCIKQHREVISDDADLLKRLASVRRACEENFAKVEDLLNHNICMVSHFTGVQIGQ